MSIGLDFAMPRRPLCTSDYEVAGTAGLATHQLFVNECQSGHLFATLTLLAGLLLIIPFIWTERAIAQNTPDTNQKLILTGAVDLALKQNLELQIANIETATREQDLVIARSELLPHVSLEADDSVNRHSLRALLGIEIPIPTVPHSIGPYQAVHVGPTFSAPVFDLTLIRQYQENGHRLLASRAREQTVREETVLLAVSEYMAHLRALASITSNRGHTPDGGSKCSPTGLAWA